MDFRWIGLMIGVAALVLAIPLAVIANLITPRVRDWWSTTSRTRLTRRISKIENTLHQSEHEWMFTPAQLEIYLLSHTTAIFTDMVMSIGCSSLALLLITSRELLLRAVSRPFLVLLIALPLLVSLTSIVHATFLTLRRSSVWGLNTQVGRDALREELERLKTLARQE
jgi:hypothetical protein